MALWSKAGRSREALTGSARTRPQASSIPTRSGGNRGTPARSRLRASSKLSMRVAFYLKLVVRKCHRVPDPSRPTSQGDESVEPEGVAGARREPALEGGEELGVYGIDGQAPLRARSSIPLEAVTLFDGVGELAEPVAELDPCQVELESLGDPRIARLLARQGRLRGG